eukprot:3681187-Pleurochrysis_carterae.AAC.1
MPRQCPRASCLLIWEVDVCAACDEPSEDGSACVPPAHELERRVQQRRSRPQPRAVDRRAVTTKQLRTRPQLRVLLVAPERSLERGAAGLVALAARTRAALAQQLLHDAVAQRNAADGGDEWARRIRPAEKLRGRAD